jgi:hypothetical protein
MAEASIHGNARELSMILAQQARQQVMDVAVLRVISQNDGMPNA